MKNGSINFLVSLVLLFNAIMCVKCFPQSITNQDNLIDASEAPLSKFYKRVPGPVDNSDSIIFPSYVPTRNEYDRPFADRYNKHRPNIPTPHRPIPFNFQFGFPILTPQAIAAALSRQRSLGGSSFNELSPEQDALLHQTLTELFSSMLGVQPSSISSHSRRTQQDFSFPSHSTTPKAVEETRVKEDELDGVTYQSLYSGPRVKKFPCPDGFHKSHGGGCREKSRKLLNFNS